MSKQLFVIKYDTNTQLFLLTYSSDGTATWGSEDQAITFDSQAETAPVIALIGSGPIGVPKKPQA